MASAVDRAAAGIGPALLIVGASDQKWGAITLPFELSLLGMPKCYLYTDPTVQLAVQPTSNTW